MAGLASITNKIPYGAHVIVLFVLTFAAFILTYVDPTLPLLFIASASLGPMLTSGEMSTDSSAS